MEKHGRLHTLVAILLAAGLAACGSQSQANEAGETGSEEPSAETTMQAAPAADDGEESADADAATGSAGEAAAPAGGTETRREASRPSDDTRQRPETTGSRDAPTTSAAPEETREPTREASPEPARATVAAGTTISLTLDRELSSAENRKGDTFSATVSAPVIEGSRVLIPEGAVVRGTVTALQKAEGDKPPMLTLDFESVEVRGEQLALAATLTSAEVETDKEMKGEGKKIGGGAAAGGLVGGLLGGDVKGALIGAAVGSAAGTAITLATREGHAVLPADTPMEIRLDESLRVRI